MIIQVENLVKDYTSFERGNSFKEVLSSLFVRKLVNTTAVSNISFTIGKGELVGFLGPNGAGKSTTIKILSGILHPTSGTVNIMGYIPWKDRKKYVCKIGAVFGQKSQLLWDIPPIDAFFLNKAIYGIPEVHFKKKMDHLVSLLDVHELIRKPTRSLSLGERMKCEFIMAMLHSPEIVFLDEPTIGLDVVAKDKVRDFILEMNKQGVTFILTTHDLSDVERLAKRVIVINHGTIVFDDPIDALSSYLGNKKMISITTQQPFSFSGMEGITLVRKNSPYDTELVLDVDTLDLNNFIEAVSRTNQIKDMTITEPPIEDVIKELYLKKS